jgi:hypothetical protein
MTDSSELARALAAREEPVEGMRARIRRALEETINDATPDDPLRGAAVADQDDDLALVTRSGWVYLVSVRPARIVVTGE